MTQGQVETIIELLRDIRKELMLIRSHKDEDVAEQKQRELAAAGKGVTYTGEEE